MFSKGKNAAVAPPRQARSTGSFSVIGADVVIAGDVSTAENLQVNGRIEGDVRCSGLIQGSSGTIVGNIYAGEARLAGLVDGMVTARVLMLDPSARVTGDVVYETLSIESGAQIEGRFARRQDDGQEPMAAPRVETMRRANGHANDMTELLLDSDSQLSAAAN